MRAGARALTLLVPGLLGPRLEHAAPRRGAAAVVTEGLDLRGAGRLLGRARLATPALLADTLDSMLCDLAGVARASSDAGPVAPLSLLGDGRAPGDHTWIRVDPVHLRADLGRLLLFVLDERSVTMEEARAIAACLDHDGASPLRGLQVVAPTRWYLRLDAAPRIETAAPLQAHGQEAAAFLPSGPDASRWHQLLNETQMLLHACPENAERVARGHPPANSVWPWGVGRLPKTSLARFTNIWSDHPVAIGLAARAGIERGPVPGSAAVWLREMPAGEHLLTVDSLLKAARGAEVEAWRDALVTLERHWFEPLARALFRGRIDSVRVETGEGRAFVTTPALQRWLWWRGGSFSDVVFTGCSG